MTRGEQIQTVQKEALTLFEKKNKDYGDAFANFGAIGVLVRLSDKISRAVSISKSSVTLVEDESLRDTLIDLHNYAAMAIMLMDEKSGEELSMV
jgi:chemotaxis protein CheY-P-specific phosphatase CheC